MTFAEVFTFLEGFNRRGRESWEQTRLIAYVIAQSNSTKQLDIIDILPFPWDEEPAGKKKSTTVSDEEVRRLRAKAKMIEQHSKA